MRIQSLAVSLLIAGLAACSGQGPDASKATKASAMTQAQPAPPGSDRDPHGCIPSAGYSWCAATAKCERPWELAKENGFDNSADAFDKFCAGAAKSPQQH